MTHECTLAEWVRDGKRLVKEGVTSVTITDSRPRFCDGKYEWHHYGDPLHRTYDTEEKAMRVFLDACIAWANKPDETT